MAGKLLFSRDRLADQTRGPSRKRQRVFGGAGQSPRRGCPQRNCTASPRIGRRTSGCRASSPTGNRLTLLFTTAILSFG